MTAGTRPSRRTELAAPLPVPLRATAASCLIAAMMMSFIVGRALPPGVSDVGAKRWLIEKGGDRSKCGAALLPSPSSGERNNDGRIGEERKLAHREGRARRGQGPGRA